MLSKIIFVLWVLWLSAIHAQTEPDQPTGCGIRNIKSNFPSIENSTIQSSFGEFPWTISLLKANSGEYFCAGSLIHPSVVLTAAHCVWNYTTIQLKVVAGEWDARTPNEEFPDQTRFVRQIIPHLAFASATLFNNYALVVLTDAITLAEHINVICLPRPDVVPGSGETCLSSGWGRDVFGSKGRLGVIMKRVSLPVIDFQQCEERLRTTRLGKYFKLDPSFLCAGGEEGVDTCQGDGGGPLVCLADAAEDRYYQSGIVAWGIGCNDPIPAAYANVALARTWINEVMTSLGFGTSSYSY